MLKPIIISHGGHLPFMPVLLSVLGGAAAFGFGGILLGPTLLAVGYRLVNEWVDEEVSGEGKAEKPSRSSRFFKNPFQMR